MEWFRFAEASEGIAQRGFDQLHQTASGKAIGFDPVLEIIPVIQHGLQARDFRRWSRSRRGDELSSDGCGHKPLRRRRGEGDRGRT